MLTSIFPASDIPKGFTPVVHYFTKEWVRMGHEVVVMNYVSVFPSPYYLVARLLPDSISSREGFPICTAPLEDMEFELGGVAVYRIGLVKYRPHRPFSRGVIKKAISRSIRFLEKKRFLPDVIVSHWFNPQLEIMSELKRYYHASSCYVAHSSNPAGFFKEEKAYALLCDCDVIGYRSSFIKKSIESKYKIKPRSFMCYSGIPEKYVGDYHLRTFENVSNYLFVGNLIKRKYPSQIIPALVNAFPERQFKMTYIGTGDEASRINDFIRLNSLDNNVCLLGRLERDDVITHMDQADVFVMISRGETYGLVYLEAMSRGCITIASKNEGFDGIIVDGVNGFLCQAGSVEELSTVFKRIESLSKRELQQISFNAYLTAKEMTDVKMAKHYFDNLPIKKAQ